MKKILSALLCILFAFSSSAIAAEISNNDPDIPWAFMELVNDYQKGKLGDEVFGLYIFSAFRNETITITKNDETVTLTSVAGKRTRTRELTSEEYLRLVSNVNIYDFDSLPDYFGGSTDGTVYQYIHISDDKTSCIRTYAPSMYLDESKLYAFTFQMIEELTKTGDFQYTHSSGAKVLIPKEKHYVTSVGKAGDELLVGIKKYNEHGRSFTEWHSFKDGTVGDITEAPEAENIHLTEDGLYYYLSNFGPYSVLGTVNDDKTERTPLLVFSDISLYSNESWIDTENSVIYTASGGDLLALPFSLGEPYMPIKFLLNGEEFGVSYTAKNGHIQVWGLYSPMKIQAYYISGTKADFLFRGRKVLMIPYNKDYVIELDYSDFGSLSELEADLAGGDITQKDYFHIIPLGTATQSGALPLRAMVETFGGEVIWNGAENTVAITIDNGPTEYPSSAEKDIAARLLLGK